MREVLQKSAPTPAPRRILGERNSSPANQFANPRDNPSQNERLGGTSKGERATNVNISGNWNCSCGYTNNRMDRQCRSCNKLPPVMNSSTQDTSLRRGMPSHGVFDNKFTSAPQDATTEESSKYSQEASRKIEPILGSSTAGPSSRNRPRDKVLDEHIAIVRATQSNKPQDLDAEQPQGEGVNATQHWKHLRRRSDETRTPAPSIEAKPSIEPLAKASDQGARDMNLEKARLDRLEQTKEGKFVGLVASKTPSFSDRAPRNQNDLTGKPFFSLKQGSWNRWKPSPSEDTLALEPTGEDRASRGSLHTKEDTVAGNGKLEKQEADQQPNANSRVDNSLPVTEPPKSGLTAWSPDSLKQPATSSPTGNSKLVQAERQYLPPEEDRPASKLSKKERMKAESIREVQIDEVDLTRHSFKAESSTYSRGMGRHKTMRKARKSEIDYDEDEEDRIAAKVERSRQRKIQRAMQKKLAPPTPIYLPEFISVANLAAVLRVRVEDFASRMKALGFEVTSNDHILDAEVAGLIAAEFNFEPIIDSGGSEDLKARPPAEDMSLLPSRPPVVTIMGHVDHGKTTLLDWLRKSSVAASEFGGITQHIGAFTVQMPSGKIVTFLDTPGHAAFLSMRQRGANVTDIVILVVAADDSVKPQTIEAIKHAQAAKVPMIVAVNKIDKEDANVERVKQDLARYSVEIEDYGGDTQVVCVSGKTGQGMEELEDAAVALADILDMRAETDGPAEGWVLEATTKKAGRVATVLVRRGTLRSGDVIVAGTTWARVRSLKNEAGVQIPLAGPGTPVEIDGWREQPVAGDEVLQANDEQQAKSVVEVRLEDVKRSQMAADMTAVNESRRIEQEKREAQEKADEAAKEAPEANTDAPAVKPTREEKQEPSTKEVFFVIKGDVSGSVEAVLDSVSALGNPEVRPHILRSGVGPVSEFDIEHAAVASGHIIAFNVPTEPAHRRSAEQAGVKIIEENIIYRLVDDVKAVLGELLPPLVTQRVLGEAEVAQVFEINVKGRVMVPVAGCRVRNGVIGKASKVRVLRGGDVVYDGMFSHLLPYLYPCSMFRLWGNFVV